MSKKDFTNNPAMQFISSAEPEASKDQEAESGKENREELEAELFPKVPEGYKLNPLFIEKKTQRVQLVFQPSLYKKVKAAAKKHKVSMNEYIHIILREAVKAEEEE